MKEFLVFTLIKNAVTKFMKTTMSRMGHFLPPAVFMGQLRIEGNCLCVVGISPMPKGAPRSYPPIGKKGPRENLGRIAEKP
jgi:hypothetical protein